MYIYIYIYDGYNVNLFLVTIFVFKISSVILIHSYVIILYTQYDFKQIKVSYLYFSLVHIILNMLICIVIVGSKE